MWFIDKSLLSIKKKKGELLLNANNSMAWSLHILSAGLNWSSIWEMTKKRAVNVDNGFSHCYRNAPFQLQFLRQGSRWTSNIKMPQGALLMWRKGSSLLLIRIR